MDHRRIPEKGPAPQNAESRPVAQGGHRLLNQVKLFRYVTFEGAPTYQAIISVFYEAKQHYRIELRPMEILQRMAEAGFQHEAWNEEKLGYYLDQLVAWGNLTRSHDTASVARIEDFYRKRYVFHLNAIGEAAHRAVREVLETVGRSGSLQANMLIKIRDSLNGMAEEGRAGMPAPESLVSRLHDLHTAFDTLTQEATRFMGDLNRHIGESRMEEERFLLHKHAVLAYISRFVDQLRRIAPEICRGIERIREQGINDLMAVAATSADLPPDLEGGDPKERWMAEQHGRWKGICAWFIGGETWQQPTVERLSGLAVQAVVGLTRALGRINDSRVRPVDRQADFTTLAKWFATCENEHQAHRLWQASFGIYSSRHFHMAEEDADLTSPSTSWFDAAPIAIPVRLRSRGTLTSAGRPAPAQDLSRQKKWIAEKRRKERERTVRALARFANQGAIRFSDLSSLDQDQFDLLLDLLDEVLSAPRSTLGTRVAQTLDGQHQITLEPEDREGLIRVRTPRGDLWLRNHAITVTTVVAHTHTTGAGIVTLPEVTPPSTEAGP